MRLLRELRNRREQATVIDGQVTELENRLKAVLGDAETAISPHDEPALSWKNSATTRLDTARLKTELPAIYDRFAIRGTTRRFTVV